MLTIPQNPSTIATIIGIDPGSSNVGVSVILIDLSTLTIVKTTAFTINADKLVNKDSWIEEVHGARFNRIELIYSVLKATFIKYSPTAIISESPFINSRFPLSGVVLTEVLTAIRKAVLDYSPWLVLDLVTPSSVKNAFGVSGNCDKAVMKAIIQTITELNYAGDIPLTELDEHSIDAVAVGYFKFRQIKSPNFKDK